MSTLTRVPTYGMHERSDRADFYIRDKNARPALTKPHRHDYFQIQINLGGDTVQHIGGAVRNFPRNTLAFILPHRLHLIPHPEAGSFVLINFTQQFLLPHIHCNAMDLDDLPTNDVPELLPFKFQEHMDFILGDQDFEEVLALLNLMRQLDLDRRLGSASMLKGYLLQLIGKVSNLFEEPLLVLASAKAETRGRREAIDRVTQHIRDHITDPLSLTEVAAAVFLSPNYLSHLLRKETGKRFSDLVLERRMHIARTQLLHSDDSLAQIAETSGFPDEGYFSRRFRKVHGVPPGKFRRENRSALSLGPAAASDAQAGSAPAPL